LTALALNDAAQVAFYERRRNIRRVEDMKAKIFVQAESLDAKESPKPLFWQTELSYWRCWSFDRGSPITQQKRGRHHNIGALAKPNFEGGA